MLSAIAFIVFNCISYFFALYRAPFWGLIAYMNIYFNAPNPSLNWWAKYLPFERWSLLTSAVLLASVIFHWSKTSNHKFESAKWIPWFFVVSAFVSFSGAVNEEEAYKHLYLIFTYALTVFVVIKSVVDLQQLRLFILAMIMFAGNLSFYAYMYSDRINDRLESFGSADAYGSNEFSLLLAGIMPFMFAFIKGGKYYERLICLAALPFVMNAFILCNSRGSTVALAGAIILAMLIIADKEMRKKMLIVLVFALPVFVYLTDDQFIERFATLVGAREAVDDAGTASQLSSGRTEIWMYGLEMAKDNPLGVGPDGFSELAHFYMPEEVLTYDSSAEYGKRSAHNTYLQVLVEQGILGLLIWMAMCVHTYLILRRSFKLASKLKDKKPFWKDTIFALNVSFLAVLIAGMINSRVYYEFFWWQIAIAVVVYSLVKEMAQKESSVKQDSKINKVFRMETLARGEVNHENCSKP